MPDEYCELHAHSNFSFLDGASHPEELIGRAAVLGMPSLAVTDHAGLYAAVRLWKAAAQTRTEAARDAGLSPVSAIVGLELAIPADERSLRLARRGRKLNDPLRGEKASRGWPGEFHAGPMPGDHLVLLARDGTGYAALSRLASRGHLAGEKQFPVFERALVEAALDEARGHLVGLSGCRSGEVPRQLLAGDPEAALAAAQALGQPLPGWRLRGRAEPPPAAGRRLARGPAGRAGGARRPAHGGDQRGALRRSGRPPAAGRAGLHPPRRHAGRGARAAPPQRRVPAQIGGRARAHRRPGCRTSAAGAPGRTAWRGQPAIGRSCRLDLDFERYRFPGFTVPEGETPFSYLYQLAHEGLRRRYRPITKQAVKQLAHELDIIERTNLAEFFLIVWDLMEFARKRGIIGQGRGSAGDSIVAYCLGITKVDPIEHKLLFERFINEARTLPDIDIDFDVNRREEVIQYLYDRYGEDHSAMVCTVITYRARSAVREVAKALGFPLEAVDRVAKALDTRDASDVARDLALDGSFGWLFDEIGLDMEAEAVPSNRDGRRTDGGALVARESDSSWNHRPRPVLAPAPLPLRADLADAEARARDASGDHDGRPYSESGWVPPRRPRVLDQSVVSVKHEGWEQKRYGPGGLRVDPAAEELAAGELAVPEPRDNGTPGASSDRPAVVRVDPESGMPIEERRRPSVLPGGAARSMRPQSR